MEARGLLREDPMKRVQIEFLHILTYFFWILQVKKSEIKTSSKFCRIMGFSAPKTGSKERFSENREKSLKKVIEQQQHVNQFSDF